MQICLRNMSYACEPFLLLYLISLAKLDFFLAILWPSVCFILYSNYLIVPFLRVFLSLDFSWEKKKECLVLWILSIFQKRSLGKCSHACLQVRHGGALSSRRPTWCSLLAYVWPLHHFIADSLRKGTVSCQTWCVLVLWLVTGLSTWKLLSKYLSSRIVPGTFRVFENNFFFFYLHYFPQAVYLP